VRSYDVCRVESFKLRGESWEGELFHRFWPLGDREALCTLVESSLLDEGFGKNFSTTTLQSEKAKKLIDEALAIDRDEANLKSVHAPKLTKVLPIRKAVRYLQIENKSGAVVKYDIASGVPLVK